MWRFFNALCMLSVVVLLGLHGGQARSLPERPQWRSDLDRMECAKPDHGAFGASADSHLVPAAAGALSSSTPPADIGTRALVAGARVWRPPGEIASAPAAKTAALGVAAKSSSSWAPPAEIDAKNASSTLADGARVWLPPAEIAAERGDAAGPAVRASADAPATKWARPREIAAEAPMVERRSAFTDNSRVWLPPAEIAPAKAEVDRVVTGRVAARASPPDQPRSNWAPPAEIADLSPTSSASTMSNALVWRPPEEIAKPRIALK